MNFLDSEAGFQTASALIACVVLVSITTHGFRWIPVWKYKHTVLPAAVAPSAGLYFVSLRSSSLFQSALVSFIVFVMPHLIHKCATGLAAKIRQWVLLTTTPRTTFYASAVAHQDTPAHPAPQNAAAISATAPGTSNADSTAHETAHRPAKRFPKTMDELCEHISQGVVDDYQRLKQMVRSTSEATIMATNKVLDANMYVLTFIILISWVVVCKPWIWSLALFLFVAIIAAFFAVFLIVIAGIHAFYVVYKVSTYACPPLARVIEALVYK